LSAGEDFFLNRVCFVSIAADLFSLPYQDGGRFAFKSAVNLIRSANPDHLDSSHMDREALKFVVFRRQAFFHPVTRK